MYNEKEKADLQSLNIYIQRNFEKYPIEIKATFVKLLGVTNWAIDINGKRSVFESEVLAWTFIDGIYLGCSIFESRLIP